jgi:hypothetical protein
MFHTDKYAATATLGAALALVVAVFLTAVAFLAGAAFLGGILQTGKDHYHKHTLTKRVADRVPSRLCGVSTEREDGCGM